MPLRSSQLLGKEINGQASSADSEPAETPRNPLSPSNYNKDCISPSQASQSPVTPAGAPSRCENRRRGQGRKSLSGGGAHGAAASAGTGSPVAHDVLSAVASRSPRDTMSIAHLLSTTRSPWSPRHFGGVKHQPPRITNNVQGNSIRKPMTGKTITPQSGKKISSLSAVPAQGLPLAALPLPSRINSAGAAVAKNDAGKGKKEAMEVTSVRGELAAGGRAGDVVAAGAMEYLRVHLFVAAIGDGELNADTHPKSRDILQQVIKKVSKEQNTVISVNGEGSLHIQLRVFVASSVEARTLKEYIHENQEQAPCPFILLAKQLPMAVMYDPATLNPSSANVADRLRKQAKTRAIKLLREIIWNEPSGVTAAMLRGRQGPLLPSQCLEELIMKRAMPLDGDGERFISFPAVRRQGDGNLPGEGAALPWPHHPSALITQDASGCAGMDLGFGLDAKPPGAVVKLESGTSAPSGSGVRMAADATPCSAGGGGYLHSQTQAAASSMLTPTSAAALAQHRMVEQHFPVSLTVIAIGEGVIVRNTQPKLHNRLKQLMNKVPKEHHW